MKPSFTPTISKNSRKVIIQFDYKSLWKIQNKDLHRKMKKVFNSKIGEQRLRKESDLI